MSGLCNSVTGFASLFIVLALLGAVAETVIALYAKVAAYKSAKRADLRTVGIDAAGPVMPDLP